MIGDILSFFALAFLLFALTGGALQTILPAWYEVAAWWKSRPARREQKRQVRTYIRERKRA